MADYQNNQPPRPKNALNNQKLNLVTKNESGKNATLKWDVFNNNPRVTVYTNVEGDKDNGRISGNMDPKAFYVFLELLKRCVEFVPTEAEPELKFVIKNQRPNFPRGGGKPDGMVTASETMVGCDKEGCVWIAVTAYNRPRLKFVINHDEWHMFFHASGEQLSKGECSKLFGKAYYNILTEMVAGVLVKDYVEPPPRDNNNRGGGSWNNNRNNNGGGSGSSNESKPAKSDDGFEDDLPF